MAERVDDPSITDDEALWRRIKPTPVFVRPGEGGSKLSSAAFLDGYTGEVSVHRAKLTTKEQVLARYPGVALAAILAGLPRSLGHAVVAEPTEDDPSHAVICPPAGVSNSKRKEHARRMAESATWVVPPPGEGSSGG